MIVTGMIKLNVNTGKRTISRLNRLGTHLLAIPARKKNQEKP